MAHDDVIEELDLLVDLDTDQAVHQILLRLVRVEHRQEQIMGALEDLQAADANLATEVTAILTDVQTLLGQVASSVDPAALAPVTDDLNALSARIAAVLPAPVDAPAEAPPADAPPADAPPA